MKIGSSNVFQLGEPSLRQPSKPVKAVNDLAFRKMEATLQVALEDFRREIGFGRSIAAPQAGFNFRFLAMNLGKGPFTMVNPTISWRSKETFMMWDDCMSFPTLFVRLQRNKSITVDWVDTEGKPQSWKKLDQPTSELLQHEIDHLDGILAVDRAAEIKDIITRDAFDRNPSHMKGLVDYTIPPLVRKPR